MDQILTKLTMDGLKLVDYTDSSSEDESFDLKPDIGEKKLRV